MILSEGSLLRRDRIRHLAREDRQSGMIKCPLDIFANREACSESLNGYLEQHTRMNSKKIAEVAEALGRNGRATCRADTGEDGFANFEQLPSRRIEMKAHFRPSR